jgi:hypothetical protein
LSNIYKALSSIPSMAKRKSDKAMLSKIYEEPLKLNNGKKE